VVSQEITLNPGLAATVKRLLSHWPKKTNDKPLNAQNPMKQKKKRQPQQWQKSTKSKGIKKTQPTESRKRKTSQCEKKKKRKTKLVINQSHAMTFMKRILPKPRKKKH
jgi:hypothetical protein